MADLPPIPAWFDCTRHTAEREAQVAALVEAVLEYRIAHRCDSPRACASSRKLAEALAPFQPKPKEDTDAR